MAYNFTSLPTADAVLAAISTLPFGERVRYAVALGRQRGKDKNFDQLIRNLRQHPDPEAVEVEAEEGITEIFPPQQKNVAKHYAADHVALMACLGAARPGIFQEELASPSMMFKKLAVREVVRDSRDDDALLATIVSAVPRIRKELIQMAIRQRRHSLVDRVFQSLLPLAGVDTVLPFLHACSAEVVFEQLSNAEVLNHHGLNWKRLCTFHVDTILKLMDANLSTSGAMARASVFAVWMNRCYGPATNKRPSSEDTEHMMRRHSRHAFRVEDTAWRSPAFPLGLLKLHEKYPVLEYVGEGVHPYSDEDMGAARKKFEVGVKFNEFTKKALGYCIDKCPDEVARIMREAPIIITKDHKLVTLIAPDAFPLKHRLELMDLIMKASKNSSLLKTRNSWQHDSADSRMIWHGEAFRNADPVEVVAIFDKLYPWLQSRRPTWKTWKSGQNKVERVSHDNAYKNWRAIMDALCENAAHRVMEWWKEKRTLEKKKKQRVARGEGNWAPAAGADEPLPFASTAMPILQHIFDARAKFWEFWTVDQDTTPAKPATAKGKGKKPKAWADMEEGDEGDAEDGAGAGDDEEEDGEENYYDEFDGKPGVFKESNAYNEPETLQAFLHTLVAAYNLQWTIVGGESYHSYEHWADEAVKSLGKRMRDTNISEERRQLAKDVELEIVALYVDRLVGEPLGVPDDGTAPPPPRAASPATPASEGADEDEDGFAPAKGKRRGKGRGGKRQADPAPILSPVAGAARTPAFGKTTFARAKLPRAPFTPPAPGKGKDAFDNRCRRIGQSCGKLDALLAEASPEAVLLAWSYIPVNLAVTCMGPPAAYNFEVAPRPRYYGDGTGNFCSVLLRRVHAARAAGVPEAVRATHLAELAKILAEMRKLAGTDKVDALQRFADLENHQTRKDMHKAADSASAAERVAALTALSQASCLMNQEVQVTRTLKYIRQKIKNEAIDNRKNVLEGFLTSAGSMVNPHDHRQVEDFLALRWQADRMIRVQFPYFGAEHLPLWLELLADALAAPDINKDFKPDEEGKEKKEEKPKNARAAARERSIPKPTGTTEHTNHQVLSIFQRLSEHALLEAANRLGTDNARCAALADFATEVQWKLACHFKGPGVSAPIFQLKYEKLLTEGPYMVVPKDADPSPFVEGLANAYTRLIGEPHKLPIADAPFLDDVFRLTRRSWAQCEFLKNHLSYLLNKIKETKEKDADGLLVIDKDNHGVKVFQTLFKDQGRDWVKEPLLVEYIDVMMHSRLAMLVLPRWYKQRTFEYETREERRQKREKAVLELLKISKSAIHLRVVWRFLMRYRQDLLDEFINARSLFAGVFYLGPDDRYRVDPKLTWDPTLQQLKQKRMEEMMAGRMRGRKGAKKNEKEEEKPKIPVMRDGKEGFAADKKAEEDLRVAFAKGITDTREMFCLPGVFGLHRLLPRQATALGEQYLAQSANVGRSLSERGAALIRWTLMPTTTYADCVAFVNRPRKKSEALPVNLHEIAIRGVMYNDEPAAAIQYLLAPSFLGSDLARVAIYSVSKCIPFMAIENLTKILLAVLTGKRRNAMKVTAYKEVIRLLASRPSEKHLDMIHHEWARKELHRDVRVAILGAAIRFLRSPAVTDIAWNILEEVVERFPGETEILCSLLGAAPSKTRPKDEKIDDKSDITTAPRLVDYVVSLARSFVPQAHCPKYAKIICNLCHAKDHNLRALAIATLVQWKSYDIADEAAALLRAALLDVTPENTDHPVPDTQKVYNARWQRACRDLLEVCGCKDRSTKDQWGNVTAAPRDLVVAPNSVIAEVTETLCKLLATTKSRAVRRFLLYHLEYMITQLPPEVDTGETQHYSHQGIKPEEEAAILQPLKATDGLFWDVLMKRRAMQLASRNRRSSFVDSLANIKAFFQELITVTYQQQEKAELAFDLACSVLDPMQWHSNQNKITAILRSLVCGTLAEPESEPKEAHGGFGRRRPGAPAEGAEEDEEGPGIPEDKEGREADPFPEGDMSEGPFSRYMRCAVALEGYCFFPEVATTEALDGLLARPILMMLQYAGTGRPAFFNGTINKIAEAIMALSAKLSEKGYSRTDRRSTLAEKNKTEILRPVFDYIMAALGDESAAPRKRQERAAAAELLWVLFEREPDLLVLYKDAKEDVFYFFAPLCAYVAESPSDANLKRLKATLTKLLICLQIGATSLNLHPWTVAFLSKLLGAATVPANEPHRAGLPKADAPKAASASPAPAAKGKGAKGGKNKGGEPAAKGAPAPAPAAAAARTPGVAGPRAPVVTVAEPLAFLFGRLGLSGLLEWPRYTHQSSDNLVAFVRDVLTATIYVPDQVATVKDMIFKIISSCFVYNGETYWMRNGTDALLVIRKLIAADHEATARCGRTPASRLCALVALELVAHCGPRMGRNQEGNELLKEWDPEFEALLDEFCADRDPAIRRKALGVTTTVPLTASHPGKEASGTTGLWTWTLILEIWGTAPVTDYFSLEVLYKFSSHGYNNRGKMKTKRPRFGYGPGDESSKKAKKTNEDDESQDDCDFGSDY